MILSHAHPCPAGSNSALDELLAFGLVVPHPHRPGRFIARDPLEVLAERRERSYEQIGKAITGVARLPEVLRPLAMAYQRAEPNLVAGAVEYVAGMEAVNSRLSEIIAGATQELLTAQPGGPRPASTLALSLPRDTAAIRRGVAMRTLYRADCRDDDDTAKWAAQVTQEGAHVRTLGEDFLRAVIIDRRIAVVADHTPLGPGREPIRALILHDPGVVHYAAVMFDRDWDRATPWRGDRRPRATALTEQQRQIMRMLVTGVPQATVAKRMDLRDRAVHAEISKIKAITGTTSLAQMGYWFARHEAELD
ncbi:TrmB family transcriptional regulator sugar-binding domain-containing protein [Kitasatospora sp. NPDC059646]|uniref:TrmB family transcriptional regulator sugar-binding domain-containing protein n=1 Tax=Kitasatospora sp. NPDC059646 TaxID=3346893 RepID=UPI00369996FD